jgi:membrane-bound serine protease (ClpP class)
MGHPRIRIRRWAVASALLLAASWQFLLPPHVGAQPARPRILQTTIHGTITPVVADHLRESVARAEGEGYGAFLVELDTPGGLDSSMRDIIQAFLNAEVPVIVYVAPQGARAASAGALITMSAHIAAMAPGTSIGAATPIDLEAGDVATKIINDAASYAVSIAEERGRNEEFAEDAVREGRSVPASEAAEIRVVDLVAPDRAALLAAIDGRTVELADGRTAVLHTVGAPVDETDLGWVRNLLQTLADPNLAFLFISIGTLAILYELANPGIGGGAIVGAILLVLAFAALSVFPVNIAGVLLLVLGVALLVAELFVPGVGVMAAGGTVALVLGGLFLFRGSVGVDPVVLIPTAVVAGAGTLALGRVAWRTRRAETVSGTGAIVGHRGRVRSVEGPDAQVFLQGSWWKARPAPGTELREGQDVRVVEMEGLVLVVEPIEPEPTAHEPEPLTPEEGTS